jgi:HlyD family secretion protein
MGWAMSHDNRIFRKVALDRLASPEQLDQLLPVVDRRGWLALGAFGLMLLTAAGWSLRGSIPQNVNGTGILVNSGGVVEVIPVAGGRITEVTVHPGDTVARGQVVARMAQPDLTARLKEARASLNDLLEHHQELTSHVAQNVPLLSKQLARQRGAAEEAIRSARNVKSASEEKIVAQRPLVKSGLLLRQTLLETMQRRDAAVQQIEEGQSQLAQIAVREAELRNQHQDDQSASARKIREARRVVDELTREIERKTEVVASAPGRVLEVVSEPGMMLATGEPVLTVDVSGKGAAGLEAVIFVPSVYGKQIQAGMRVLISPTTIKQEEFGMIAGQVKSVSEFPTTVKGMQRLLKNDKLVSSLSGGDAPYEVHAELFTDPATASGYRWSSSKGPPRRIGSGSLATANIAVSYRRPIDLVIPLLREQSGI